MEIGKGIRAKIFILFSIMGMVPFVILVVIGGYSMVADQKSGVTEISNMRNAVISEHVSNLIEKNQAVLESLAGSPNLIEYIQDPTEERRAYVLKILHDADDIFGDNNVTVLTGFDAWQVIRTDGGTLVNVKNRQYFQEAMRGRTYVSNVLSSISSGKMIVVLSVPVFDVAGNPIGMVQRNFNLKALQDFVKGLDDSENSIIIMDRNGRIIANSDKIVSIGTEYAISNEYKFILDRIYDTNGSLDFNINDERNLATYSRNVDTGDEYKFILDRIYNTSGSLDFNINGEKNLAAYSRNADTGWIILTVQPYHFITDRVFEKSAKVLLVGVVIIFVGMGLLAYLLTLRLSKPIIEITTIADRIAGGDNTVQKIELNSNDELGRMVAAFNKIRSERDDFRMESELDKLTELFNKKTMENLCRMKLKTFNEDETSTIFLAFYIIDLDHFKEVNDLLGHQFGDKVLVEFAKGLKRIFRPNDFIGRFGGDEFIVIIDRLPHLEIVTRKAEQIRQTAYNLTVDGKSHFVTASIGISLAPHNGLDYDVLFAEADKAVYHVKNNGKNNYYCRFIAEMNDGAPK